jgi:hypothetical protein
MTSEFVRVSFRWTAEMGIANCLLFLPDVNGRDCLVQRGKVKKGKWNLMQFS